MFVCLNVLNVLIILLFSSEAYIRQQPDLSRDPAVAFDVSLAGTKQECAAMLAQGSLREVNVQLTSRNSSDYTAVPADIFVLLRVPGSTVCLQIGGFDYFQPSCVYAGAWPVSWTDAVSAISTNFTAHLQFSTIHSGSGSWEVCIGNGLSSSFSYSANGVIHFSSDMIPTGVPPAPTTFPTSRPTAKPTIAPEATAPPTRAPTFRPSRAPLYPTPFPSAVPSRPPSLPRAEISSSCDAVLVLDFDCSLASTASCCTTATFNGTLEAVSVDFQFTSSSNSGGESAGDMAVTIVTSNYMGVQFGGLDRTTTNIDSYTSWPAAWASPASAVYSSRIAIDSTSILINSSDVVVADLCITNDWRGAVSGPNYRGQVIFENLYNLCIPPSPMPSPQPSSLAIPLQLTSALSEEVDLAIDIHRVIGGSSNCISVPISGSLSSITADISYTSFSSSSLASDLLLYVSLPSVGIEDASRCVQIGGRDLSYDCVYAYSWPDEWNSGMSGVYNAAIDLDDVPSSYGDHSVFASILYYHR